MYSNTLGSFTRYREKPDGSSYRQVVGGNVIKELRFAHSNGGKTPEGLPLRRHLVGMDITVLPTATNGLTKPEKVTVNLTTTHTDGMPLVQTAAGTTFADASIHLALVEIVKIFANSSATNLTGLITSANIKDGEI